MGILDEWKVTRAELDEILATRPSARGYLFGFVAEYKVTKMHFTDPRISGLGRSKDHERARPGDFGFNYNARAWNHLQGVDGMKPAPKVLDQIADVVLAYRPKPKTKPAKRRKRRAAKIAKGGDAGN